MTTLKLPQGYWLWCILAVVSGGLLLILTLTNTVSLLRAVLAYGFLLICPGLAWSRMLPIKNGVIILILAVAPSLVIAAIIAEALLYTNRWSFNTGLVLFESVTFIGIVVEGILRATGQIT